MQPVEQHAQQFLRVLLILVVELLLELRNDRLQLRRRDRLFVVEPELLDQLGVADHELALRAQRVVVIYLVFEFAGQEVISQTDHRA